jgi:enoyl-CoA hydratase/3-hydroxyacyl-CoA dehydrogenase
MDIDSIRTLVVVGAGTMGREIAQVALMGGFNKVVLNDINQAALEDSVNYIKKGLIKLGSRGHLNPEFTPDLLMSRLITELELKKAVESADFIIEAIPERMDLKQSLFQKLGELAPKDTVLATNSSTMSITKIASLSGRDEKVVGMHHFIPIPLLRLIEVIKGEKTSDETAAITVAVGKRFPAVKGERFLPILKESPGFIVNRLLVTGSVYPAWLLDYAEDHGIPFEDVDADKASFAKFGPFAQMDYLGLETVYNTEIYFGEVVSPDLAPGRVLTRLVKEGNLGRPTGKGILEWTEDGQLKSSSSKKANLFNMDTYFAIQLNEGCRLLTEGVVSGYKMIDDTMLAGMDVPGPFGAGKRNYKKWCELLEDLVEKSGKKYFKPCELMKSGKFIQMRK